MNFKLSPKCEREFKKNSTLSKAATASAERACKGMTGTGRSNCMSQNVMKYKVDNISKFCPNDPAAIYPSSYGFRPKRSFMIGNSWYANSDGYGGDTVSSLVSTVSAQSGAAGEEEIQKGHSQDTIQKYLMFGTGAFLLLALIKPAIKQAK